MFWNDDLETIATFVLKSFRRIEDGEVSDAVLDKFKDDEDARFGGNWDIERLAFMDMVILETAIAEIMNFPKIPLSVSVNEYIELAKSYSSTRSGSFVHGILGAVVARLQKEVKLLKK